MDRLLSPEKIKKIRHDDHDKGSKRGRSSKEEGGTRKGDAKRRSSIGMN